VVVGVALWWLIGDYQGSTMSALGAAAVALTYTGNVARSFFGESQGVFSPMWSLSMEEQFYIVWPPLLMLLIALVATRRVMVAVLGVLVVASVVASGLLFEAPGGSATPAIYFSPVLNVAPLLLGCALALVMGSEAGRAAFQGRFGAVATWVGLAGVVGSLALIGSGWQQTVTTFTVMLPGVAVASALLIGGLVSRASLPARVLSLGPVAWFGRALSYPIYHHAGGAGCPRRPGGPRRLRRHGVALPPLRRGPCPAPQGPPRLVLEGGAEHVPGRARTHERLTVRIRG
jgi:peptidoglycan/LPS O-acetylase OafA/YrhL